MSWGACYRLSGVALFQEGMQAVRQDPEEVPSDTVPKTRFGARGFILGVTGRYIEQCRGARRVLVPTLAGTLVLKCSSQRIDGIVNTIGASRLEVEAMEREAD